MGFYAKWTLVNGTTVNCRFEPYNSYFEDSSVAYSYLVSHELESIATMNSGLTVTGINHYYQSSSTPIYAGASVSKTTVSAKGVTITYKSSDEDYNWEAPKELYLCLEIRGAGQSNDYHYATWKGKITSSTTSKSFVATDNVVANQSLNCGFKLTWSGDTVKISDPTMGLSSIGGSINLLLASLTKVELILSMGTVTT